MNIIGIELLYPDAVLIVIAVALAISIFSALVHRKMVDRKKMDEIRKRIEDHQKEYMTAQKEDNKKKLKQLEKEQIEVMGLLKKNFMMSMKPMLVTMPAVLLVLWALREGYEGMNALLNMPFNVPFLTYATNSTIVSPTGAATLVPNAMNWFGIYLVVAIATSLVLELILRKVFNK